MKILRRLIQSAVESFPIDQERKDAILKKLLNPGKRGAKILCSVQNAEKRYRVTRNTARLAGPLPPGNSSRLRTP